MRLLYARVHAGSRCVAQMSSAGRADVVGRDVFDGVYSVTFCCNVGKLVKRLARPRLLRNENRFTNISSSNHCLLYGPNNPSTIPLLDSYTSNPKPVISTKPYPDLTHLINLARPPPPPHEAGGLHSKSLIPSTHPLTPIRYFQTDR